MKSNHYYSDLEKNPIEAPKGSLDSSFSFSQYPISELPKGSYYVITSESGLKLYGSDLDHVKQITDKLNKQNS